MTFGYTSSMADGLGMNEGEWDELRRMVQDSFWVMRVIGECAIFYPRPGLVVT